MKVKELIAELQKLDPEKNFWVIYDPPCYCGEPDIEICDSDYSNMFDKVDLGDYAIICW